MKWKNSKNLNNNKMFHEKNQVNNFLNCPNCKIRYNEPKVLPCGNIICNRCISKLDKIFKCKHCLLAHLKPDDGFPSSELVINYLLIKPAGFYTFENFTVLKEIIKTFGEKFKKISLGINNSFEYINEHCFFLKKEAEQSALNSFEKEHISNHENPNEYQISRVHGEQNIILFKFKQFYTQWTYYLKKFEKLKEKEILDAIDTASSLREKYICQNLQFDNLFFKRNLKNVKNWNCSNSNCLGSLNSKKNSINFNLLKKFSIKDLFPDYKSGLDLGQFSNGCYLASYYDTNWHIQLKTFYKEKQILNSYKIPVKMGFISDKILEIVYKISKNLVIISIQSLDGYFIKSLNENLQEMHSIRTTQRYTNIAVNNLKIYCLSHFSAKEIVVYSFDFRKLQCISLDCLFDDPFYCSNFVIQFESKSDKYFLLNSSALRIIDVERRFLLKNIAVNASKVMLDSCDHLILMINSNSLITVCDFYGNRMRDFELENFPQKLSSFIDSSDQINFYDKQDLMIFYQS